MSGILHPKVKYPKKSGVKAKPEKRPRLADEKAALNAALARRGNSVTPLRQRIGQEFRRSKHFGRKVESGFEDEADGLEGLIE